MTQCQLAPTTEDRAHQGTRWECRPGVVVGASPLAYEGCNVMACLPSPSDKDKVIFAIPRVVP